MDDDDLFSAALHEAGHALLTRLRSLLSWLRPPNPWNIPFREVGQITPLFNLAKKQRLNHNHLSHLNGYKVFSAL